MLIHFIGLTLPDVDPRIIWLFYRSVYTHMHLITAPDMCAITFETMKEVNRQRLEHDDEFYHVSNLKYYVTRVHALDVANNCFMSYSISTILLNVFDPKLSNMLQDSIYLCV
jgi:hypothetical protein